MTARFLEFDEVFSQGELADLIRAYRSLPGTLARKHLTAAMRRSVRPFQPALRAATPVRSGNLRRSVKTIVRFYDRANWGGNVVGIVGYSRGASDPKKRGNHSTIVEDGTRPRFRKNRASTGSMPPRRMLRDAVAARRAGILDNLSRELVVSLEKAARELATGKARGKFRGY